MGTFNQPVKIVSYGIVGIGAALLAVDLYMGGKLNVALPLVFLMLGGVFTILVFATRDRWRWAPVLYIPGALLFAFGVIFLLNVLTGDWQAWAYAWLLLVTGLGVGLALAAQNLPWPVLLQLIGWGLAVAGVTFFAIFGAIAGGLFIEVMAPLLIIAAGLSLRWIPVRNILPEAVLKRLHLIPETLPAAPASPDEPVQPGLVEPLSTREIEVLRLVDEGLSNQQIAQQLNIAASTVKTHINNIYGKLDVQTRTQAIRRARELGILKTAP